MSVTTTGDGSDIALLTADMAERAANYARYAAYYAGRQEIEFAGEKLQSAFGDALAGLVCNRCAPVVDAFADRLQIAGFTDANGKADEVADAVWTANTMHRGAGEIHTEALTSGDAYLIVWPDMETGAPRLYPNLGSRMAILYDDEVPGQVSVAAKAWRLRDRRWRLNLYYADRLEKYISAASTDAAPTSTAAYQPYQDDGDRAWPVAYDASWTGTVPVFHFANNARTASYGRSELADIIPLQDRLNMSLANLAIAEEFQSFRQRWATGLQPLRDPNTGEYVTPFKAGAGQIWLATNEATKFGDFEAADLNMFGATAEGWETRIARTARVPMHYLLQTGQVSGETLKVAEGPFVAKVEDRQRAFGIVWERAMTFALRVAGISDTELSVQWQPAESRIDKEFWEVAALRAERGVSDQQILREFGYTDAEIEQMADEAQATADKVGAAMGAAFNAGQFAGNPYQNTGVQSVTAPSPAA